MRVALLCGGQSAEHEVSLRSARSIINGLSSAGFDVMLIAIEKSGRWTLRNQDNYLENADDPGSVKLCADGQALALSPGDPSGPILNLATNQYLPRIDVVFPVLHGTFGEDGTVQGLLRLLGLPFIGADVLGSAIAMDKEVAKRLLAQANILSSPFICVHRSDPNPPSYKQACGKLGNGVLFVKPSNAGSSVGVSRVTSELEYIAALDSAFKYDQKILVEQGISGREIEISVLGNEIAEVSLVGEIIPGNGHTFYSYESKYLDPDGSTRLVPTKLNPDVLARIQAIAKDTYRCICCEGFARIDFFLTPQNEVFVNEVNTIPGFTSISMYPQLWQVSGLEFEALLKKLVQLALDRHARQLKTSFER